MDANTKTRAPARAHAQSEAVGHGGSAPPPDGASSLHPPRGLVARAAEAAHDPRLKGIVLSRMFDDDVEPQRIGRFTLLDRLGEGGMGVVYTAYDDQLDRKIAVKVLRSWLTGDDSQGRSRLIQEARAMARLSHPNIVTVHEVGTHGSDVFVAMEYVRGQSLDRWLRGAGASGRPWREVVEVFAAAGRGLAAAHRAGIVHRDFKPHNAIIDDEGRVRVLDFGLARVEQALEADESPIPRTAAASSPLLTETGAVMGTPAYMSPEQHRGDPVDERSDQFSFFASLYHALYQQLPFPTESTQSTARASAEGRVRAPPSDSPVPRWLHRAVLVGLSPDTADRYASMSAALGAICGDPAARRRRWLGRGTALLLVAGTSAGAVIQLRPEPSAPCDRGERVMAQTWSAQAQTAVEQGIGSSGMPFASETWARLQPRLDAYAEQWSTRRDEACIAHRDGAQSASLYDLQVACLERRQMAFESLVELLSKADRAAAERAMSAAARLPSINRCDDASALLASIPPPDDPERAQEVEHQRRRLVRVARQESLGQYDAGLAEATEIAAVAERLEYRPLLAEVKVRLGSLTMEHGSPHQAEDWLTEALSDALASSHFEVAIEAVAQRIFVRAERMRTPERARDDVALGAGLIGRSETTPRLRGLYFNNVGAYHIRREDHDAARRSLTRALEIKRKGLQQDDPDIAYTLGNLSIVEQHAGRDRQARDYLDQALDSTERALGPHHPMTAELGRLRGELLMRTGQLAEAGGALEAVLLTLHQTVGPHSPMHHGPLIMLGEIALMERDYATARARFEQAVALELPEEGGGSMYQVLEDAGLARALMGQGEFERGLAIFEEALALAQRSRAPYESTLRELLARTLLWHDRPQPALVQIDVALGLERAASDSPTLALASLLAARGRGLRRLGRLDEAQGALAEADATLDAIGGVHRPDRAALWMEHALVSAARGRRAESIAHARAAVSELESWGEADHPDRVRADATLARTLRSGTPTSSERGEADELARRARAALSRRGAAFGRELDELDDALNQIVSSTQLKNE